MKKVMICMLVSLLLLSTANVALGEFKEAVLPQTEPVAKDFVLQPEHEQLIAAAGSNVNSESVKGIILSENKSLGVIVTEEDVKSEGDSPLVLTLLEKKESQWQVYGQNKKVLGRFTGSLDGLQEQLKALHIQILPSGEQKGGQAIYILKADFQTAQDTGSWYDELIKIEKDNQKNWYVTQWMFIETAYQPKGDIWKVQMDMNGTDKNIVNVFIENALMPYPEQIELNTRFDAFDPVEAFSILSGFDPNANG